MQTYFQGKLKALSGRGPDAEEAQKNLLPELYVNNKFFESIFGSNAIDITPQGTIGIVLAIVIREMTIQSLLLSTGGLRALNLISGLV